MTGLLAAEWLKLRSVRAFWGYLASVVAFAGIGAAGTIGAATAEERAGDSFTSDLAGLATLSALIALVLGIVVVTGEFRHGTITPTFLATPQRERVLAAKLAFVIGGAVGARAARARRHRRQSRCPGSSFSATRSRSTRRRPRRSGGPCSGASCGPPSGSRSAPPSTVRSRRSSGR